MARDLFCLFQLLNMSLMIKRRHLKDTLRLLLDPAQFMVKKSLLFCTSQLSSKIEKKRFAHVPLVPSQQNTLNLRPFLHKVTGLSLLSRLTSSPELLSMMVWTNLDLLQERLLNRLLLVVQMLFMASRLETPSIMVTCFYLKILVNNL